MYLLHNIDWVHIQSHPKQSDYLPPPLFDCGVAGADPTPLEGVDEDDDEPSASAANRCFSLCQ